MAGVQLHLLVVFVVVVQDGIFFFFFFFVFDGVPQPALPLVQIAGNAELTKAKGKETQTMVCVQNELRQQRGNSAVQASMFQ